MIWKVFKSCFWVFLIILMEATSTLKVYGRQYSIVFDSLKISLDTIYRKQPIRVLELGYANNGTKDVGIAKIEIGCGCTKVDYVPVVLKPGEKSSVKITLDTTNLNTGMFVKDIYVYTNPTYDCNEIILTGWIKDDNDEETVDK